MAGCSFALALLGYLARARLARSLLLLRKRTGPPREHAFRLWFLTRQRWPRACCCSAQSYQVELPTVVDLPCQGPTPVLPVQPQLMPREPRSVPVPAGAGNIALVLTDVEGSTELWEWVKAVHSLLPC